MKKIITILGITLLGFIVVNAILSLTSSEIKNYTDKGYILSDNFITFNECNTAKQRYNTEYSSYKRSECFSDGEGYKYFICGQNISCNIGGGSSINNASLTSDTTVDVPYKDKLDKFLEKLKAKKSDYANYADYVKMLDKLLTQLGTLKEEYKNNSTISAMIDYLISGINLIKEDDDIGTFLCKLTGDCNTSESTPINLVLIITHKNAATGNTQSVYYSNENLDIKTTNIGKNVKGCMEKVGVASSSCNIDSNWISLPNPRYYSNNSWKLDNYNFYQNHGEGTFIGYHKDLDTGKVAQTKIVISSDVKITPGNIMLTYRDKVTKSTKSTYYKDEVLEFEVNGAGQTNIKACMERIGDSTTSCNNSNNWVSPPSPRYYNGNNTWKLDTFQLSSIPSGTYKGYWKDTSNGKQSNIVQFTVLNQNKPEYIKTSNITYKGNHKLDVYIPTNITSGKKIPVALIVHGGGWYLGNKDENIMVEFGKYFHKNGIAYIPIDYTLSSANTSSYDNAYKDIDCALQWVVAHKDEYNFDMNNFILGGGSAGAHLSLQYALNQSNYHDFSCSWGIEKPSITKVLPVALPSDLTKDLSNTPDLGNINYMIEWFLGLPRSNTGFMQRAKDNSPLYSVGKDNKNLKYYIVHGLNDGIVNYSEQALPMYNAMKDNGYNVQLDTNINGHDGVSVNSPNMIKFLKE